MVLLPKVVSRDMHDLVCEMRAGEVQDWSDMQCSMPPSAALTTVEATKVATRTRYVVVAVIVQAAGGIDLLAT